VKQAYFDCTFGVAGDMLLGALLDLGADAVGLLRDLESLALPGGQLKFATQRVKRCGLAALKFELEEQEHQLAHSHEHAHEHDLHSLIAHTHEREHRSLSIILELIENSQIGDSAKHLAGTIFRNLGLAEAKVHGVDIESVHFHEVGAVDAIVDIVGFAIAYCQLGIEKAYATGLPLGGGTVKSAHGLYPVPGPAVLNLIAQAQCPTIDTPLPFECTTPTGAAIITTIASEYGRPPAFAKVDGIGYGAGNRDPQEHPNVVRVMLGESVGERAKFGAMEFGQNNQHEVFCLEANLDDCSPQIIAHTLEQLMHSGALDVAVYAATMKKGRPGHKLSCLAPVERKAELEKIIFRETTTLGVRSYLCQRTVLERQFKQLHIPDVGSLAVKVAYDSQGNLCNVQPEFEEAKKLAELSKLSLKELLSRAAQCDVQ
jgi:uncharacterized protein (TIGR00299 family) protein